MIDKIKLHCNIDHFKIKDSSDLIVAPSRIDYKTNKPMESCLLFHKEDGSPVVGSKAYIDPDPKYHIAIDINAYGLSVEFNPSKLFYKKGQFYSATGNQTIMVGEKVQKKLTEYGIIVDIYKMNLSRIDLCKDILLTKYFKLYENSLPLLSPKRMLYKKIGSSTYFTNQNWEIIFYNKLEEMKKKKVALDPEYSIEGDVLRCEIKIKNKKSITDKLAITKLKDVNEYYDVLKEFYSDTIAEIFKDISLKADKRIYDEKGIALKLKDNYKTNNALRQWALKGIQQDFKDGTFDIFFAGLKEAGYSRQHLLKVKKQAQDLLKLVPSNSSVISAKEILAELKTKLI